MSTTLQIRCTSGGGFKVKVDLNKTTLELKKLCQDEAKTDISNMKLIYKGKILKDEEKLSSASIKENHVVILIKSKKKTQDAKSGQEKSQNSQSNVPPHNNPMGGNSSQQPNQGGPPPNNQWQFGSAGGVPNFQSILNDPQSMMQTMQNPMVQEMMRNVMNNPEMMRSLLENNPIYQNMSRNNPNLNEHLRMAMNNPQMLNEAMNILRTSNPSSQPQQGQPGAPSGTNPGTAPGGAPNNQMPMPNFATFLSGFPQQNAQGGVGNVPPQTSGQQMPQMPVGVPGNPRNNPVSQTPPNQNREQLEEKYKDELAQLSGMGFTDKDKNITLLEQTNGNVTVVIDRLLSGSS